MTLHPHHLGRPRRRGGAPSVHRSIAVGIWVVLGAAAAPALSHPEGFSGLRVQVYGDHVHASLTLHTRDLSNWFPPLKYPDYVAGVCRELERTHDADVLEVRADDDVLAPSAVRASSPEVGMVQLDADYPAPAGMATVRVWSKHLVRLPRGHQQSLSFEDWRRRAGPVQGVWLLRQDTLTEEQDAYVVELPAAASAAGDASAAPGPAPAPRAAPGGGGAVAGRWIGPASLAAVAVAVVAGVLLGRRRSAPAGRT